MRTYSRSGHNMAEEEKQKFCANCSLGPCSSSRSLLGPMDAQTRSSSRIVFDGRCMVRIIMKKSQNIERLPRDLQPNSAVLNLEILENREFLDHQNSLCLFGPEQVIAKQGAVHQAYDPSRACRYWRRSISLYFRTTKQNFVRPYFWSTRYNGALTR